MENFDAFSNCYKPKQEYWSPSADSVNCDRGIVHTELEDPPYALTI